MKGCGEVMVMARCCTGKCSNCDEAWHGWRESHACGAGIWCLGFISTTLKGIIVFMLSYS